MSFAVGDIIVFLSESEHDGWWRGELAGKIGVFPSEFMEKYDEVSSSTSFADGSNFSKLSCPPGNFLKFRIYFKHIKGMHN